MNAQGYQRPLARLPALPAGLGVGEERLPEAGRILERGETRGGGRLRLTPPKRSDGGKRAEHAADEEVARAVALALVRHDTIVRMLVCTLGDLTLDVIVRLEGAFVPGDDSAATTHVGAGGQAANVAAWAAALGAEARLITKRGDDHTATLALADVSARGVDVVGPVTSERGGVVVSVVGGSEERSMLTDRGPAPWLRAEEVDVGWLRGAAVLHVSGYALLEGPIAEAGARAVGAAQAQRARISVDLASAEGIREFGPELVAARLRQLAPDILFAGERELDALGAEPACGMLVVKHGAGGLTVRHDGVEERHDAPSVDVVDPTGAGDALAAGMLVGGIELGLEAAARCLATMGAMP